MYQLNNYKSLDEFKCDLKFARGHFKNGEWVGIINDKYIHEEGITKEQAINLYQEGLKVEKKRNSVFGRLKIAISPNELRLDMSKPYKTFLDVMYILKKDFIDEKDFENILTNAEYFYNTYYKTNSQNEELTK